DPVDADVALLRIQAPFDPRDGFIEQLFHAGRLTFNAEELEPILAVCDRVPTIVDIQLDRPAVIPEIAERAAALLASFGAADDAILDVVCGRFAPQARLPFELPSSVEAVEQQLTDVPYDSADPL